MKKLLILLSIFTILSCNSSKFSQLSIIDNHTLIYHQDLKESILEFSDKTPVDSLYFPDFLLN
jgi:hypothetical protein